MRLTGRISPDNPTSPAKQHVDGIGISAFEDNTAQTTAKSIAGSSTLIPPAKFKNTSFTPIRKPHRFSSTANNIASLLKSNPVDERWGVPYAAELTKACVSISIGRIPSIVAAIATPLTCSSLLVINTSEGLLTSLKPFPSIS